MTTKFDDPQVQKVYEILCSDETPPAGEHWEGFAAKRIVTALREMQESRFTSQKFALVRTNPTKGTVELETTNGEPVHPDLEDGFNYIVNLTFNGCR